MINSSSGTHDLSNALGRIATSSRDQGSGDKGGAKLSCLTSAGPSACTKGLKHSFAWANFSSYVTI